jgi:hypothetical protein
VASRESLEALSSKELHDRAVALAKHRLDIGFLWGLARAIPAADVVAGRLDRSETDILVFTPLLNDIRDADEGALADALRPFYIDYILEHEPPDRSPGAGADAAPNSGADSGPGSAVEA